VPMITLLGLQRAAAVIAFASLGVFSVALLRLAARDGVRVACGCFGRALIDVRVALLRNVALATMTVVSWSLAHPDPRLTLPEAGDALPALLVAGALVVAAVTAWRSTVWLGKGRV
jgi:methylamine utilization protein MauE